MGIRFRREFAPRFKKEYNRFLDYDHETAAKIKVLIADVLEHPAEGPGKPERLRHRKSVTWSRHIDKKNRLVYTLREDLIYFESCKGHYDDH
jgi:toxin YoeB